MKLLIIKFDRGATHSSLIKGQFRSSQIPLKLQRGFSCLFLLRTREISDIFNTFDEIYLVFTEKKYFFFNFFR